jgi:hypothetical protein
LPVGNFPPCARPRAGISSAASATKRRPALHPDDPSPDARRRLTRVRALAALLPLVLAVLAARALVQAVAG